MLRLAYFVSHPIQYQAPLLRAIAADPEIDLHVFFYSDFSLRAYQDVEFGQTIQWDVPLTQGYDYTVLDCWGSAQPRDLLHQPVAKNIYRLLQAGQFDAVWVHGWSLICGVQAILAAERLGIPVLMRGESHLLQQNHHFLKRTAKTSFLKWLFSKVSRFLYIGQLNRQLYAHYGVDESRLFPVPYAVDNEFFQKRVAVARCDRHPLRQSLGLEPGRPIILYAAKLIAKKCPQDLLAAYRLLSKDGVTEPDPYLLFVGDGALRTQLEAAAQATGWQSIHFLGFRNQSEMPALYDLCNVFALPSSFEPWGLAINEVMNAGKAVVVSDQIGCVPDLVRDGQNGRVFPVGNITAFAEAMQWAIAHSEKAGQSSLQQIQRWSFQEDLQGLKASLTGV